MLMLLFIVCAPYFVAFEGDAENPSLVRPDFWVLD